MLKIRLTRRGKKNKAFFRLVVAEHTAPVKGRFLEALGFLNPHTKEKNIKADRVKYWLEKGAQCSDTVHNLLVGEGIIKGPKRAVKIKKKEAKEERTEPARNASPARSDASGEKPERELKEGKVEEKKKEKEESIETKTE